MPCLLEKGYLVLFLQLGEAARLKPLEVELKRLEDLSEAIVQDFAYMRQREEEMRDTNGINQLKHNILDYNIT